MSKGELLEWVRATVGSADDAAALDIAHALHASGTVLIHDELGAGLPTAAASAAGRGGPAP